MNLFFINQRRLSSPLSLMMLFFIYATSASSNSGRDKLSMDTVLHVTGASSSSIFRSLLGIARQNHIPMGIVVEDLPNEPLCNAPLILGSGEVTISTLATALQTSAPHYSVQITHDVLELTPRPLSPNVFKFLDLKIASLKSGSRPHTLLGSSLWMGIRGVIAPGEGTDSETLFALDAEQVQGLDIRNKSVNFILDTIVTEGSGGVWVLHSSKLKTLSNMTPIPYEIHGYNGEDSLESSINCFIK